MAEWASMELLPLEDVMEQLTDEKRVTALERAMDEVRCEMTLLRQEMNARFDGGDGRFSSVEERLDVIEGRLDVIEGRLDVIEGRLDVIEGRLDVIEGRLGVIERRLDAIEAQLAELRRYIDESQARLRLELQLYVKEEIQKLADSINARIDALDARRDVQMRWMMGMTLSILLSQIGVIVAVFAR